MNDRVILRRRRILIIGLTVLAGLLVVGYWFLNHYQPHSYVEATITIPYLDHPEISVRGEVVMTLHDKYEVEKLVSYLRGVGRWRPRSLIAGGWISSAKIDLHRSDGRLVLINVSDDYADYSDGYGDGSVRNGLESYLIYLLKKRNPD